MVEDFGRGVEEAESQKHKGVQGIVRLPRKKASPEFLPPVGGKGPGGQGYSHHIAGVPVRPLSPPSEQCGVTVAVKHSFRVLHQQAGPTYHREGYTRASATNLNMKHSALGMTYLP